MAGRTMPQVIGPGSVFMQQHLDAAMKPASSASVSATDCPRRHGKPDRRNERICHRPITTGSRKTATPAIHPASNRFDSENFDDLRRCGSHASATAAVERAESARQCHHERRTRRRLSTSTGTATRTGGTRMEAIGSSNVTPNAAASSA